MVGHSYGGTLVRLFAKNYPSQVFCMVLVESAEQEFTHTPSVFAAM